MDKIKFKLYDDFRNNVFCRHEYNQHIANKLWEQIKVHITDESDINMFKIEWNHYLLNHCDVDIFSKYFNTHIKKYF